MKKIIFVLLALLIPIITYAATRSIVPRADDEGKLGTSTLRWSEGHFDKLYFEQQNNIYYIDATETDQGATGNGRSLKALVDTIGASKNATIVADHTGTGNTTIYTFATSETIPRNITLRVKEGAYLTYSGSPQLVICGYIDAGNYQWIDPNSYWVRFGSGAGDCPIPYIPVTWFGALGNGTTIDTQAIQATFSCLQAGYNKPIYFPEGKYILDDEILITRFGLNVYGDGFKNTQIRCHSTKTSGRMFLFSQTFGGGLAHMDNIFRDLRFYTRGTCRVFSHDFDPNYATPTTWRIDRCWFTTVDHTANAGKAVVSPMQGSIFNECVFEYCTPGIEFEDTTNRCEITNCVFFNNFQYDIKIEGNYSDTPSTTDIESIIIKGCTSLNLQEYNGIGASIYANQAKDIKISNCVIRDTQDPNHTLKMGMWFKDCKNVTVENVTVKNATLKGFYSTDPNNYSENIKIIGSSFDTISDSTGRGIHIIENDDTMLIGNYINDSDLEGILLEGCIRSTLIGNHLIDNGDYGIETDANCDYTTMFGNQYYNNTTGKYVLNDPIRSIVREFDALEETMVVAGELEDGNTNDFAFAWQNPHAHNILITRVLIDITTAGGTATSVLNVGSAANGTTGSDNLIDGIDLNAIAVYDNIDDQGGNGGSKQKLDQNGGATDWITGQITVEDAGSLVGKYYIYYIIE